MVIDHVVNFPTIPLHTESGGFIPGGSRVEVFHQIFDVFLVLGTLVGVIVIGYMTWKAYKYRTGSDYDAEEAVERPRLGELPRGSGGGRKLFVSFSMSAIIVVSLIAWTYGTLLYVEASPSAENGGEEPLEIEVVGSQFDWEFVYPNGNRTDVLRAPRGEEVQLRVTSSDVFHTFGVPGLRVKADGIPGQTTETWFIAEETGTYEAQCYELCGAGHSYMNAEVIIMEPDEFREWYSNTTPSDETTEDGTATAHSYGDHRDGYVSGVGS